MNDFTFPTYGTFLLMGVLPFWGYSQTVNTGDFHVSRGSQFSSIGDFHNTLDATFINNGEAFVYADFNNNGSVDFTDEKQGITYFVGSNIQVIDGDNISYFYDVLFNNPSSLSSSFELKGTISIENKANFAQGILKNDEFGGLIIFESEAEHTGVDNEGHVDGLVQKIGDASFEFPIGDNQIFRPASIGTTNQADHIFKGKYLFVNPNTAYPVNNKENTIIKVNNAEYWTITNASEDHSAILTLSWDTSTTPIEFIDNHDYALHIVRWDETLQRWLDEGGVIDVQNQSVSSPITLPKNGIFTLGLVLKNTETTVDFEVFNALSANNDGINDYFRIDNIQNLANNSVEIYNRWGVKVFSTTNYDTNGNVFKGISNGRVTIDSKSLLPTGTYFYILQYDAPSNSRTTNVRSKNVGYLYLTSE